MNANDKPEPPEFDRFHTDEHDRVDDAETPADPVDIREATSLRNWEEPAKEFRKQATTNAVIRCGWGRVLFAHTFEDPKFLAKELCREAEGKRDLALYLRDPHVAISVAPDELFLDPSHTFRLDLTTLEPGDRSGTDVIEVRSIRSKHDIREMNRLFLARHMVPVDPEFCLANRGNRALMHLVAIRRGEGVESGVVGTVTGIDHEEAFNDPEGGSSLWTLAVDPQARTPGIGIALIKALSERFRARGRSFMDLSVLADNEQAIGLYEKLGFQRVPVFCLKHKHNPVNEHLFVPEVPQEDLNPYGRIIVDEAARRGIAVEVLDGENGYFKLTHGGRSVTCRESLSEMTSAVAMSRCADKTVTLRLLKKAGLFVPEGIIAAEEAVNKDFLFTHRRVVVKPVDGEQGLGISVDVRTVHDLLQAIEFAKGFDERVLIEQFVPGQDLRIIVIDGQVVAAAIRKPAAIVGDGRNDIRALIEKQSRRREAATGGESSIPLDDETVRCVRDAGYELEDVILNGEEVVVRKAANLHTGGTIHDVTAELHPTLGAAAIEAAAAIGIPVVGLDLLVPDVRKPEYTFIEANERPGLANHEPQPTAECFIDMLFPLTAPEHRRRNRKPSA